MNNFVTFEKKILLAIDEWCNKHKIEDEEVIKNLKEDLITKYHQNKYDFSNYNKYVLVQKNKKRLIVNYLRRNEILTLETVLDMVVRNSIREYYNCGGTNRKKIKRKICSSINKIKNDDFTIILCDFKKFHSTVSNEYVYEKYIRRLNLTSEEHKILKQRCSLFPYCLTGNCLTEMFCRVLLRDFDRAIKKYFKPHNIVYYQRWVDDCIIILNKQVNKEKVLKILDKCVKILKDERINKNLKFPNRVKLNKNKFVHILSSDKEVREFKFLGKTYLLDENNNISVYKKRS